MRTPKLAETGDLKRLFVSAGPGLIAVVTGVLALALSFLVERPLRIEGADPRFARVIDLCVDQEATEVLADVGLAAGRRRFGVTCRSEGPAAFRYVVLTPKGPDPLFASDERSSAQQLVFRENERLRDGSGLLPTPDDYIRESSGVQTKGCPSKGLKSADPWSSPHVPLRVDVDNDGRSDRFLAYSMGDVTESSEDVPPPRMRVEFASGAIVDVGHADHKWRFEWGWSATGSGDADGNGTPEIWLALSSNNYQRIGLAVFDRCEPRLVVLADGDFKGYSPFFAIHQRLGETDDIECTDIDGDEIREVIQTYESRIIEGLNGPAPQREGWSFTAYRLDGDLARIVSEGSGDDLNTRPRFLTWKGGQAGCGISHSDSTEPVPGSRVGMGDVDCEDFRYYDEAQAYFLMNGAPEDDPDGLDEDTDLVACEQLPGRPTLQGAQFCDELMAKFATLTTRSTTFDPCAVSGG